MSSIIHYPNELLKTVSVELQQTETELMTKLFTDLRRTLKKNPGVGVAAIQIGVPKRVFIMDSSYNKKYRYQSSGEIMFINPKIIAKEGRQIFREGCLSVPDYTADITRAQEVTIQFLDEKFNAHERVFTGFEAVIIQHENDHLDGKLFIDRLNSVKDIYRRQ